MKFTRNHFKDGGDTIQYQAGRVYNIEPQSVERWLKRGAAIVPDTQADDDVVEAQLDASLAVELEKDGKGTHEETTEAIHHAAEVADELDEEEFEDADDDEAEQTTSTKKKKKKSSKR